VPVVLIVENNQYAYSTPTRQQMRVADLADRAAGYAMPGVVVDGNDWFAVHEAAQEAVERARGGGGPSLLECKTMRMRGHAVHDNMAYVPPALLEEWRRRDPIVQFETRLRELGLLDDDAQAALLERIERDLDQAQAFAEKAPLPDPARLTEGLYAS
jgi:pyruvate dehydrogenase E1 component alpha subunit